MDLDQHWRTPRLDFEPLTAEHAAELAPVLDDATLHEFTGGAPLDPAALAARYARLQERHSPDGRQLWGNWLIRVRGTGTAAGTVQVTLPSGGPVAGAAEVAWVVGRPAQGHPAHLASQQVARAAGLTPTGQSVDGEIRWSLEQPAG
jgi:RimJ/RimL family protein N-acetyltransferase